MGALGEETDIGLARAPENSAVATKHVERAIVQLRRLIVEMLTANGGAHRCERGGGRIVDMSTWSKHQNTGT